MTTMARSYLPLILAVSLVACKTADLSSGGARVATSRTSPMMNGFQTNACQSLGYLVGRGGGSFGGDLLTNESLIEHAMNDLRNQVAERGGNYVEHDTPQLGMSGSSGNSSTTTATVSGTAYRCDLTKRTQGVTVTSAAPRPSESSAPEGAGGFRLSSTLEDAANVCSRANGAWTAKDDGGECSITPVNAFSVGPELSKTVVHACKAAVCGIDILVTPSEAEVSGTRDAVVRALSKKYGTPRIKAAASSAGTTTGPAWVWSDGNRVGVDDVKLGSRTAIRIAYSNPEQTKRTTPGPAL